MKHRRKPLLLWVAEVSSTVLQKSDIRKRQHVDGLSVMQLSDEGEILPTLS
jgi:hypothetical protein